MKTDIGGVSQGESGPPRAQGKFGDAPNVETEPVFSRHCSAKRQHKSRLLRKCIPAIVLIVIWLTKYSRAALYQC
eukprot:15603-Heterococcus_DN1.PRE.3